MSLAGTLEGGASIEATAFDGHVLVILSPRAFAPGAPVVVTFDLAGDAVLVQLKAHGSKRTTDGRFEVRGRTIGLRREHRDRLISAMIA